MLFAIVVVGVCSSLYSLVQEVVLFLVYLSRIVLFVRGSLDELSQLFELLNH